MEYDAGITYQPINALTISFSPNYQINKSKTQFVPDAGDGPTRRYVTAALSQQTLNATIRLNYCINPNLTIQYYGQPFISRGTYKSFNYVSDARAKYYGDRITLYTPNQIAFNEVANQYTVDENEDGTSEYSFDNPEFFAGFVQFESRDALGIHSGF